MLSATCTVVMKIPEHTEKIQFRETDTLYTLGDVVDRGDGGIKILLDMIKRKNVIPLRGNHDYLAYCLLKNLSWPLQKQDTKEIQKLYRSWFCDGGYPTYTAFVKLPLEKQKMLLAYLNTFLLYDEVKAGGKSFFCPIRCRKKSGCFTLTHYAGRS